MAKEQTEEKGEKDNSKDFDISTHADGNEREKGREKLKGTFLKRAVNLPWLYHLIFNNESETEKESAWGKVYAVDEALNRGEGRGDRNEE